ncbi:MAG: hypothetical protein ACWIPI_10515 [Polaribacter sp.]
MFLSAYFTTGRIIFMIFFIIAFIALMIYSYRKDFKNHKRYYKNGGRKVAIYGGLIVIIFMSIRYFTTHWLNIKEGILHIWQVYF